MSVKCNEWASAGYSDIATALAAGLKSIQKLGSAAPGDKTMIDAYAPALAAFQQHADAGADFAAAALAAADAAEALSAASALVRDRLRVRVAIEPLPVGVIPVSDYKNALVYTR